LPDLPASLRECFPAGALESFPSGSPNQSLALALFGRKKGAPGLPALKAILRKTSRQGSANKTKNIPAGCRKKAKPAWGNKARRRRKRQKKAPLFIGHEGLITKFQYAFQYVILNNGKFGLCLAKKTFFSRLDMKNLSKAKIFFKNETIFLQGRAKKLGQAWENTLKRQNARKEPSRPRKRPLQLAGWNCVRFPAKIRAR
jgi:hypothetical protein